MNFRDTDGMFIVANTDYQGFSVLLSQVSSLGGQSAVKNVVE
jgi:hypothetical protein